MILRARSPGPGTFSFRSYSVGVSKLRGHPGAEEARVGKFCRQVQEPSYTVFEKRGRAGAEIKNWRMERDRET